MHFTVPLYISISSSSPKESFCKDNIPLLEIGITITDWKKALKH